MKCSQRTTPVIFDNVCTPLHVKRKERPRSTSLQSTVEKICKKHKSGATTNKVRKDAIVSLTELFIVDVIILLFKWDVYKIEPLHLPHSIS